MWYRTYKSFYIKKIQNLWNKVIYKSFTVKYLYIQYIYLKWFHFYAVTLKSLLVNIYNLLPTIIIIQLTVKVLRWIWISLQSLYIKRHTSTSSIWSVNRSRRIFICVLNYFINVDVGMDPLYALSPLICRCSV